MLQMVHTNLGNSATLFVLILAVWGLVRFFRGLGVDGTYLGAVVICELLFVVQGAAGGLLFAGGGRPERAGLHILYGVTILISFPALFAYTRGRDSRQEQLLWGIMAFFVWGLLLRAQELGA